MTRATKIFALLGRSVDYSYSPLIHNSAFRLLELPCHYTVFNIPSPELVGAALQGAKALGIGGFSVTIPYKKTVVPFLDELSGEAASIQAVNTIVNDNGRLVGHNTDIGGFAAPLLPHRESISGKRVSLFGAGGAALAAIKAFNQFFAPEEILLFVRDREKTRCQLEESGYASALPVTILLQESVEEIRDCRLIVNATPLGTRGNNSSPLPLDRQLLSPGQIVYDMVYNPLDTPLLQAAQLAGATTIPGIEMLIGQAELAFTLWTALLMPTSRVREELLREIQQ
ncbi:MAG: shikimate dehydrogenase [Chlorobium sp.]